MQNIGYEAGVGGQGQVREGLICRIRTAAIYVIATGSHRRALSKGDLTGFQRSPSGRGEGRQIGAGECGK